MLFVIRYATYPGDSEFYFTLNGYIIPAAAAAISIPILLRSKKNIEKKSNTISGWEGSCM